MQRPLAALMLTAYHTACIMLHQLVISENAQLQDELDSQVDV